MWIQTEISACENKRAEFIPRKISSAVATQDWVEPRNLWALQSPPGPFLRCEAHHHLTAYSTATKANQRFVGFLFFAKKNKSLSLIFCYKLLMYSCTKTLCPPLEARGRNGRSEQPWMRTQNKEDAILPKGKVNCYWAEQLWLQLRTLLVLPNITLYNSKAQFHGVTLLKAVQPSHSFVLLKNKALGFLLHFMLSTHNILPDFMFFILQSNSESNKPNASYLHTIITLPLL